MANLDLFRWSATEAAQCLGYVYPALLDERVTQLVNQLYGEDSRLEGQSGAPKRHPAESQSA